MASSTRPSAVIVVPACGFSERFRAAGIDVHKALIRFHVSPYGIPGEYKTMLQNSLSDLRGHRLVVVARPDDEEDFTKAFSNNMIIQEPTEGQAHTVKLACETLEPDSPVLVINCDNGFRYSLTTFLSQARNFFAAALVVPGRGDTSFSYVDDFPMFRQAQEKTAISDWALAGVYWFQRADMLVEAITKQMEADDRHSNGEFYLSGTFAHINAGKLAVAMERNQLRDWGTPEGLARDPFVEIEDPEIQRILQGYK